MNASFLKREKHPIYIGTAAWAVPSASAEAFPANGSHLERYAQVLNCAEINSSFYREHKAETYERWAESVPDDFLFSAKLLRAFTHDQKLEVNADELKESIDRMRHLGRKFGVLLIQLPPSLKLETKTAHRFFEIIRKACPQELNIACEPRHRTWVAQAAINLFKEHQISKVIADPERCNLCLDEVLGTSELLYYRLHGSPEIYKSEYTNEFLEKIAHEMLGLRNSKKIWCILDNTTFGYATSDALKLNKLTNQTTDFSQKIKTNSIQPSLVKNTKYDKPEANL